MGDFVSSFTLLFLLLNPFLLIIYLTDLVQEQDLGSFFRILLRAGVISGVVFTIFALLGNIIFDRLLQAQFASFQIFGGVVFLLIGLNFVFSGPEAIKKIRGKPEHIAGSIAMPIMIGPGSVSASILAGNKLGGPQAILAIGLALAIAIATMVGLKMLHDFVKQRNEKLIDRYVEIMGRITALVVGTFSIEMIMQGLKQWLA